jgi:hypothetical protein
MHDRFDRRVVSDGVCAAPFPRRYDPSMDATTRELLDRAALAATLLESCEADVDPDVDSPWLAEIAQRAEGVRVDGPVGIPWATLKAELLAG